SFASSGRVRARLPRTNFLLDQLHFVRYNKRTYYILWLTGRQAPGAPVHATACGRAFCTPHGSWPWTNRRRACKMESRKTVLGGTSMATEKAGATAASAGRRYRWSDLQELIFLDRYAQKGSRADITVGDTVVVLTKEHPRYPQQEVGVVEAVDGDEITVRLRSGELFVQQR